MKAAKPASAGVKKTKAYTAGFQRGRIDGFEKGRRMGYQQGMQDALNEHAAAMGLNQAVQLAPDDPNGAAISDQTAVIEPEYPEEIRRVIDKCKSIGIEQLFSERLGIPLSLHYQHAKCLKETSKSVIWELGLVGQDRIYPVILKIFIPPVTGESLVEWNFYEKAHPVLGRYMPQIYYIHRDTEGEGDWVFMEYVQQMKGQIVFHPQHFDAIIPKLASLHAHTFNERFEKQEHAFSPWLPKYTSSDADSERTAMLGDTLEALNKAMHNSETRAIIKPHFSTLKKILRKGPIYFQELIDEGQSIVHSDLQTINIGCNNLHENGNWDLRFLDWEGVKFAPCWSDMANLVGVFLAYRQDWRKHEDEITRHCVNVYTAEMKKNGIEFKTDPLKLYKMAYLQRLLEKGLYLQLTWEMEGRPKGAILQGSIDKIMDWGKELELY